MSPLDDAYLTTVASEGVLAVPELAKRSCRGCMFLGKNAAGYDTCAVAESEVLHILECSDEKVIYIRPEDKEAYVTEWVASKLE